MKLVVSVRILVSASTLLICWPREAAQVSVFGRIVRQRPAGREWDEFSLSVHCLGEVAEEAVPPSSILRSCWWRGSMAIPCGAFPNGS